MPAPIRLFAALAALVLAAPAAFAQAVNLGPQHFLGPFPMQHDRVTIPEYEIQRAVGAPISRALQRRLSLARDHVEHGDFAAAIEVFEGLDRWRLRPVARAIVDAEFAGVLERAGQPERAVERHRRILASEGLDREALLHARYSAARLELMQEHWSAALGLLEPLLVGDREHPAPAGAWYMSAIAHYAQQRPHEALESMRLALERSESPSASWLRLVAALYRELERYEELVPLLERIAEQEQDVQAWRQLSAVQWELGRERAALDALRAAHAHGLLRRSRDLRWLAALYRHHGMEIEADSLLHGVGERGAPLEPVARDEERVAQAP